MTESFSILDKSWSCRGFEKTTAEQAPRATESWLRTIIQTEPECVKIVSREGFLLEMNPAGLAMLEANSLDEVQKLPLLDFILPEYREAFILLHEGVMAGKKGILEFEVVGMKGRRLWLETHAAPLRNEAGEIEALLGITRDITEHREAQRGLRERAALHARLADIAKVVPGALVSYHVRQDGSASFPYASAAIKEIYGVSPEALAANAEIRNELLHPDDLQPFQESIMESARTLRPWRFEFRVRHPSKGEIWVEGHSVPERRPDGSTMWHGFLMDITERKRLEEHLRQSQKMDAIGQLAGGVAHDFNNIALIIHGNASLLLDGFLSGEINPNEGRDYLDQIIQAAERAASLTRQLLMFSRKQAMEATALDLNEVVLRTTTMFGRILGEHIALRTNCAPFLPFVNGDPGMIEQILLNLAVNSRDAMAKGGTLSIVTEQVVLDEARAMLHPDGRPGRFVRLGVNDTGSGIPPAVLPHIFEPFFTTKEVGKGTGLGLATVYGVVRQHHGWIEVVSELGVGTSFDIYFPAIERQVAGHTPRAATQIVKGTETILVVEDEVALRELVARFLKRCGYQVLLEPSGRAALDSWPHQKNKISLLLTDLVMPEGVNGLDLARQLQADSEGLKVIFTSGYSADVTGANDTLVEGWNFLQKPYPLDKLARIIRARLDEPQRAAH
jgi:two-component system cell cycle sensor histidine kinase/response regulator CckA